MLAVVAMPGLLEFVELIARIDPVVVIILEFVVKLETCIVVVGEIVVELDVLLEADD